MSFSFLFSLEAWQLMLILLALMIICAYIGLFLGRRRPKESKMDSTILGSLFGLLGLLLAFTFSLSANFFGMRRELIVEESNNISTAILRADLYRESDRQLFRKDFAQYVDARIDYYGLKGDIKGILAAQNLSVEIQRRLWTRASLLSKDSGYFVASLQMIPALNNMIDINNSRYYGDVVRLPDAIIYLLILMACACSFFLGYTMTGKELFDWPLLVGFCLLTSLVVFVIFDLDRPRRGAIRLDKINHSIINLKQLFTEDEKAAN